MTGWLERLVTSWKTHNNIKNTINYFSPLLITACLTCRFRNSIMPCKCVKSATSSSFPDTRYGRFFSKTCALNSAGGLSNIYGQGDDLNNFVLSGARRGNILHLGIWIHLVWETYQKMGLLTQVKLCHCFQQDFGYHVQIRHQEGLDLLQSSAEGIIIKTSPSADKWSGEQIAISPRGSSSDRDRTRLISQSCEISG